MNNTQLCRQITFCVAIHGSVGRLELFPSAAVEGNEVVNIHEQGLGLLMSSGSADRPNFYRTC